MTLHDGSTTEDMVEWLRGLSRGFVGDNYTVNLLACAGRLEALYLGEEKMAVKALAERITELETAVASLIESHSTGSYSGMNFISGRERA